MPLKFYGTYKANQRTLVKDRFQLSVLGPGLRVDISNKLPAHRLNLE